VAAGQTKVFLIRRLGRPAYTSRAGNSVWIAIETIGFWLHCDVTTEAAVCLNEVFVIAQKGQQPFWHLETKYLAPLLSVAPVFPVSI